MINMKILEIVTPLPFYHIPNKENNKRGIFITDIAFSTFINKV